MRLLALSCGTILVLSAPLVTRGSASQQKEERVKPKTWERKQWKKGGGDALLYYVVFGSFPEELKPSRGKYRLEGIPEGIGIDRHSRPSGENVMKELVEGAVRHSTAENTRALAQSLKDAPQAIVIKGTVADPGTLNYLRDVVGLITYALDSGGLAVWDAQTLTLWSPADWKSKVFDPDGPAPHEHVVIYLSREKEGAVGTLWIHTRGLRKFGRPDLSVRGVPAEAKDKVVGMCNRLITAQANGHLIPEDQEISMDGVPAGMQCRHGGTLDDPDFNNVHVDIRWPAKK